MLSNVKLIGFVVVLAVALNVDCPAEEPGLVKAPVSFQQNDGNIQINIGEQPIGEYVFSDDEVRRPYFRHLRTRAGAQLTRNHPPEKGPDLDDHPTMHPGLWLAFSDLDGADFWRNKGRVRHVRFLEQPIGRAGTGSFTVRNVYETEGRTICTEDCEIVISVRPDGYLLEWISMFYSEQGDFTFGDQEEMGLGIRVATPLAVENGGTITDSGGRRNGAQVWGNQAEWCEYSGGLDGQRIGIVLMPHPQNFRQSWFHARDYGLLVANPFGQNAFTNGEKSLVHGQTGREVPVEIRRVGLPDSRRNLTRHRCCLSGVCSRRGNPALTRDTGINLTHFFLPLGFFSGAFCFCIFFRRWANFVAGFRAVCCRLLVMALSSQSILSRQWRSG